LILRPDPFLRWFEPVRDLRKRPAIGLLIAVAAVAFAIILRYRFSLVMHGVTYTVFFPALALATLVGGAGTGFLALALSALVADYLFQSQPFRFSTESAALVSTAIFLVAGAMLVVFVSLLNRAVDRISQEAAATKGILEAQPVGIVLVDERGITNFVNARIEQDFGYSRDELRGKPVDMLVPEARREEIGQALRRYMSRPEHQDVGKDREFLARRKDGSCIPVEMGLTPFRAFGFVGVLATVSNVSERREIERRELLASEVRHRARNVLTIVQILARRTLPQREREPFLGMLQTIARTHELLGEHTATPLRGIVEAELGGLAHGGTYRDCDVSLTPQAAQDFALIVHELTSNAIKYGGLSCPQGLVDIDCSHDGRDFTFHWKERGGPEVRPPSRRGFGSTILKDLARGFAGKVEIDYAPDGLRYQLRADLARISQVVEAVPPPERLSA
jgi:PAS domain S-box-containing protein